MSKLNLTRVSIEEDGLKALYSVNFTVKTRSETEK
jgi:hypothetical protein